MSAAANRRQLRGARRAMLGARSRAGAFLTHAARLRVSPAYRGLRWLSAAACVLLALLLMTGTLLSLYYYPEPEAAYGSVRFLTGKVTTGWLIRSVHLWAGELLLFCILLHLAFVYFRRAYARPREYEWVAGVCLLLAVLAFRFTGRFLPWDTVGYEATRGGLKLLDAIPVLGGLAVRWLQGDELGPNTLSRFYTTHVLILPWLTVVLATVHFYLVRRHGLKEDAT